MSARESGNKPGFYGKVGGLFSDMLILLAGAKVFLDLAFQRMVPLTLCVVGSVIVAFALGINPPGLKRLIREGLSFIVIVLYGAYFFCLKEYGAPGGNMFYVYAGFATTLFIFYILGKVLKLIWFVILAIAAILIFSHFFVVVQR